MNNHMTYLSNPEHRAAAVERLALSFADSLRDEIGEKKFQELRARNATKKHTCLCASHDFCDANAVMSDSFNTEIGWDCNLDNDEDVSVRNDAWNFARANHLTASARE